MSINKQNVSVKYASVPIVFVCVLIFGFLNITNERTMPNLFDAGGQFLNLKKHTKKKNKVFVKFQINVISLHLFETFSIECM